MTKGYILGATFVFLLTACSKRNLPNVQFPKGAQAGNLVLEPCNFETKTDTYTADCGTLIVPENRANPESRLITLPVMRIRAKNNHPALPIFYLEGGPGMSNMHAKPPAKLLENHDFVMVGYRGVDGLTKLDCPEVAKAIKGDGLDVLSKTSLARLSKAMRQCSTRLQDEGIDLDGYTILEVIEDIEAVRQGLGYERINLFSASYGTRVAQFYANQYPDQTHRSIMIGVNPPGRFVWEPAMIDAQIRHYSELYAQTGNPLVPNLSQAMFDISHNMPDRWLFLKIDPGKVKIVTFAMLFHRNTAAQVFDAWLAARNGDPSGLALMSLAYDFVIPGMSVYGEFFSKGISADYDANHDYFTEMAPPESIIGSPLSQLIWGSATDSHGVTWPTALMPDEFRQVQPSDVETLLISGNVDFSTPAEFATRELLPELSNGKQVILSEMGHVNDVMTLQSEAIEHLITHYYDTGKVDDSLFKYEPMDFQVKLGFPTIAKLSLGGAIVFIIAIFGALWTIVKRIQRRQEKNRG